MDDDDLDPVGDMADNLELDLVMVEVMPDYLRALHRGAGNWGTWPLNGADRKYMPRHEAEAVIEDDPDGYNHLVKINDPDEWAIGVYRKVHQG